MSDKKIRLLDDKVPSLFFRYLIPGVSATVMISLNYFVDALCIGRQIGQLGLSALSIAQPAAGLLTGLGSLFGIGGATLFSIHLGRGERQRAQKLFTLSFSAVLALGLVLGALGLVFLSPLTDFLGGTGASRQGVADYLTYTLWFAPLFSLECFLSVFLCNDRAPRLAMVASLASCGLNIVLDVWFIFFLGMGMMGASLATSLGIVLAVVIQVAGLLRKGSNLHFCRIRFRFSTLFRVVRSGMPSFVQDITQSVVMLTFNNVLMVASGELSVAVYGVISNLVIVVSSAVEGVSGAMQPIVSANAGAGRPSRVKATLKLAVGCAFALAAVFMLLCEIYPQPIIRLFINAGPDFMTMAVPGVRIAATSLLLVAANMILTVYFQAVQADNEALVLSCLRGIVFPVVCVLFGAMFFGLYGIWASMAAAEVLALVTAFICLGRVQVRLRERNYQRLNFFVRRGKVEETLDEILDQLGAEDLSNYLELISYCGERDEDTEGVPAYIGLDDLTSGYEGGYTCAGADEGYGLWLAIGALLFTDLYEQNAAYVGEKQRDEDYPAAAPAMSALAEKCLRFEYDEEDDETTIVPYRDVVGGFVVQAGEAQPQ